MSWNAEQAANDLERYVLREEPPAIGAVKAAIDILRNRQAGRTCHNGLKDSDAWLIPRFKCSSCGVFFASYEFNYCPNCGAKVVDE